MSDPTSNEAGHRPLVITMGDPAGIGPEIVARAMLERPDLQGRMLVAGDVATMRRALQLVMQEGHWPATELVESKGPGSLANQETAGIHVVQACAKHDLAPFGEISAMSGRAAAESIALAARWTLNGETSALVTAPIHKEALARAGFPHPGHTEFLQSLAADHAGLKVSELPVRMMLSCPGLAAVLVSIHVSLKGALEAVTQENVLETIRIAAAHFDRCGVSDARIAVAGLNPHAGEGGLFGREEIEVIAPAVAEAVALGINVSGPHPPDTVFMRARQG
ncbi:MAG: 4-hydroxythreonine-4-phosphate dehydrogenase PdxA, partial [Hydrogenophaga sp.]|nr:4-hydroxythreonine-4-phosphate dehydrogenase PdxA [Hydrogenophaga sp.]